MRIAQTGKDLAPLRCLPRSALISHMHKAALDKQQPFHYLLGAFTPNQMLEWASAYWKNRIGRKHHFQSYDKSNGIFPMRSDESSGEVRLSIAGDWGTGTDEAYKVGENMKAHKPHFTVHLGDVYYVGNEDEVLENFLGVADPKHSFTPCQFPLGSIGTFAESGNHEMYARGYAYFDMILPHMGIKSGTPQDQEASYFCLENDDWRVIGLDTAYNSIGIPLLENMMRPTCGLTTEQLNWLADVVKPSGDQRGIVLLTHHQYYSSFESPYPKAAEQLADFIHRPVLWFWGHEHRMAIYDKFSIGNGIVAYGRCIGHGGMPIELNTRIKHEDVPLIFSDNRQYASPENITVGYNGHVDLKFEGKALSIEYIDVTGTVIVTEKWELGKGGNLSSSGVGIYSPYQSFPARGFDFAFAS